jgi:hypothetical protein
VAAAGAAAAASVLGLGLVAAPPPWLRELGHSRTPLFLLKDHFLQEFVPDFFIFF